MHIKADESVLVIIDIQERLSKVMNQNYLERVCSHIHLLVELADELSIPIILTEQYPQGLGPTIQPIQKILEGKKHTRIEKTAFGCCDDLLFNKKLKALKRKKIILVGMETHVCVYLTSLGLISQEYFPFVAADGVLSRTLENHKNGLELIRQTKAVVAPTETFLFQLMVRCATPTFKKISALLKEKNLIPPCS